MHTTVDGKPALKWGEDGKPYIYIPGNKASLQSARDKVMKQAAAIEISRGNWKVNKKK